MPSNDLLSRIDAPVRHHLARFLHHKPEGDHETTMKSLLAVLTALALFLPAHSQAAARGAREIRVAPRPRIVESFRLHVDGRVTPGTTFWVAYGPLAGHFGLIRLQPDGLHLYAATVRLPGSGRTQFAYVRGTGATRTQHGQVPGDPVVTIKVIGPVSVPQVELPTVQWQSPSG
jgi:hypothetical protein